MKYCLGFVDCFVGAWICTYDILVALDGETNIFGFLLAFLLGLLLVWSGFILLVDG